jgi:hypothetical protein
MHADLFCMIRSRRYEPMAEMAHLFSAAHPSKMTFHHLSLRGK